MKRLTRPTALLRFLVVFWALAPAVSNTLSATRLGYSPTALAIEGPGWFIVRHPESNEQFVTRCGDFFLDEWGRLQNQEGYRVQGLVDIASGLMGDVRLDGNGADASLPWSPVLNFWFRPDGALIVMRADGIESVGSQILLQNFCEPEELLRAGLRLYRWMNDAGPLTHPMPPGSPGLGLLKTNTVEFEEVRWSILPEARRGDPLARGVLTATGVQTDLGIRGEGFFLLRDSDTSALFATRAGFFLRDGDGYLINYCGLRVQGWSDAASTTIGDIRIDKQGFPPTSEPDADMVSFQIDRGGHVVVNLTDGTRFVRGRILLRSFQAPALLVQTNLGLFTGVSEAGLYPIEMVPTENAGKIHQGTLEMINATRDLLALRRKFQFFGQGALRRTGGATDLALAGSGFFIVRDPTGGNSFATRNGSFHFDEAGYLVTTRGWRVQGYNDANLATQGDVRLNPQGMPATATPKAAIQSYAFDAEGKLNVNLSDGTQFVRAQVLLQNFAQPYSLIPADGGYYKNLSAARPLQVLASAGTQALGRIVPGALELRWKPVRLTLPLRKGVRLLLTGEPGSRCTIQSTSDSKKWKNLGVATLGYNGEAEFLDQRTQANAPRSYRVSVEWPVLPE